MKRTIFFLLSFYFINQFLNAQIAADALRINLTRPLGTARALGCNGSFGAIGADFSAIGINPAGLGLFRKSDFNFTAHGFISKVGATLQGSASNLESSRLSNDFNLSSIGLVITSNPIGSAWKNVNFSIGINNTGNFEQRFFYEGKSLGSITSRFLERSIDPNYDDGRGINADNLDGFEAGLAYETGALYVGKRDQNNVYYTTDLVSFSKALIPKSQYVKAIGNTYDFNIGLAGNYQEKLSIGLTINSPFGSFETTKEYHEFETKSGDLYPFKSLTFTEKLTTEYNGIQAKMGLIFKPINALRIGLAWHTPTYHWFKDFYNNSLNYQYIDSNKVQSYDAYSPDGQFSYRLTTPMRWIGSLGYVSQYGFINIDVDYFNPSKSKFDFTTLSNNNNELVAEQLANADIKKQFKPVLQTRIGAEAVIKKLRLRAGVELLNSPYKNAENLTVGYSGGFGFRFKRVYLDFAYKNSFREEGFIPFITGNSDFDGNGTIDAPMSLVNNRIHEHFIQTTVGFKF